MGESASMQHLYSSTWGFVNKPGYTLWTESEHPRGGVAILLNPYSSITEMDPWNEGHWTPHWMAVHIAIMGDPVLVVNVYAPSDKTLREALFERLRLLLLDYE